MADTVGSATERDVYEVLKELKSTFDSIEIGAHLHSTAEQAPAKIEAALKAGCNRLDGALLGFGGCPFANDELVGNLPTESHCSDNQIRNDRS